MHGTPAVLQCNASSPLDVTFSWVFKGSETLPEGSEVSDDGRTLTVDTESVTNAGDYSCVASDGISTVSRDVTLNILCKYLSLSLSLFLFLSPSLPFSPSSFLIKIISFSLSLQMVPSRSHSRVPNTF